MNRRSLIAVVALAVVVVGGAGRAAAGERLPFAGYLEGDVFRTPVPPLVQVDIDADGVATHLGRFTLEVPHLVNPANRTAVGEYQFSAANGDTLTADFVGESTPIPDTTLLYIEEHATISGGTGRFRGAVGEFTAYRLFDTVAGETIGWFEGSISRKKGQK